MGNNAHKDGREYGRKLAGGFVPNPNQALRAGSAAYLREYHAASTLMEAIDIRRSFEAGAMAGYMEVAQAVTK